MHLLPIDSFNSVGVISISDSLELLVAKFVLRGGSIFPWDVKLLLIWFKFCGLFWSAAGGGIEILLSRLGITLVVVISLDGFLVAALLMVCRCLKFKWKIFSFLKNDNNLPFILETYSFKNECSNSLAAVGLNSGSFSKQDLINFWAFSDKVSGISGCIL